MHDVARVRELDREAHVDECAQEWLDRAMCREPRRERRTGESLHREVRQALRIATELVDRHDRGMVEARLDLCLADEPRDGFGARRLAAHPLERDLALDPVIVRRDDLAHPAATEELAEL